MVDYTVILDEPSMSVEGPTQQGVESIMEMTTMSGVTSDESGDPSFRLLLLRNLRAMDQTATVVVVSDRVSTSSLGALWWCRWHLPLRRRRGMPRRLHLLPRRGGRVMLLLPLASALLLIVKAAVQSLQVTQLSYHRTTQWKLHKARRQERDH
jgi:hypothetical protein